MPNQELNLRFDRPLHKFELPDATNPVCGGQFLSNEFLENPLKNFHQRNVRTSIDLCTELRDDQRKKFVEAKRRQQLRENNEELKVLEQQIRAGYVMRTVQAQIYEKKILAEALKASENAESNQVSSAQIKLTDELNEEEIRVKKENLKKDLVAQISQKNELHRKKYQELLEERQQMEKAMKKYKDELEKEKREEREKVEKTRREIDEQIQAQREHEAAQDQAWEEEQERYQKLLMIREANDKLAKEEKRKQALEKQLISEEIGKQIQAITLEKERKRDLLADLLCDEREAKGTMQLKEQLQKQQQSKLLALQEMERYRVEREKEKLAEKKAEEEYFQEQMRMLAERDKLDQLSDERRRKKQMEHRKALQDDFLGQKLRKAEQMKDLIRTREELVNEQKRRERLVKEERIRMLKEHAQILKYCAPGVVRDTEKKLLTDQTM